MAHKRKTDRIAELEAELKQRDRRIAELKRGVDADELKQQRELEQLRDLVARQDEHVRDASDMIDSWKQAFAMERNDKGVWEWDRSFVEGDEWYQSYVALVRKWNAAVNDFNSVVRPRNVGRPLEASEAQCAQVRKLRKAGTSLRAIMDETSLSFQTVRTIVGQSSGSDRTTRKHLARIDPDRARERQWHAKSQSRKALPKRIAAWEKTRDELRKEAKGLK